ncbi:hypothetical protein OA238_118p0400 (plasmid) [Octadecabacter arcticus 238]|uniref:Uncharacterized protein n=2 Tax=Octadecabacter arcticus TaxID=53946 RepID=M9RW53_9RHOB|nr:hypothetical protein OA238_118p0400 [Octadecabacter arcticus 238]
MAPRSPKTEDRPDLDESIQIALDAAESSMDVTAEFERISAQFMDTSKKTQQLEKVSRTGLIVGCAVAVISVTIMGLIWQRSSSGLERLAATNTELLVILTENVSTMDQTLGPVMESLRQDYAGLQAEVSAMSEKFSGLEQVITDIATISETVGLLDTLEDAQTRAEAIKTELGDRIATLNGELALNVSAAVQDTLSGQADAYNKLITEMSAVMNGLGTSDNPQDFTQIQASMNDRFKELNERIGMIQTSTPTVRAPRPQPKQQPDVIKFP